MKKRHIIFRVWFCFFIFSFAFGVQGDEEGRAIKVLREIAGRLDWSQDIFVGVKNPDEDVQIFGVSNMPFSLFSVATEKSFIQWLLGHKWSLEKILDRHLESYRELGFKILPIDGLGQRAYRAFSFSYVVDESGDLVLSRSQDVIEIFQDKDLITIRDEKLNLNANAWSIFKEVYRQVLEEKVDKEEDRFIYPISRRLKEMTLPKDAFSRMPARIQLSILPPVQTELPFDPSSWQITDQHRDFQLGQMLSLGKNYAYTTQDDQDRAPTVECFLYAYASSGEAQYAFQIYRKRFESKQGKQFEKEGEDIFWVSKEDEDILQIVFTDRLFLCDVTVHWYKTGKDERKRLLEKFIQIMKNKIQRVFESE